MYMILLIYRNPRQPRSGHANDKVSKITALNVSDVQEEVTVVIFTLFDCWYILYCIINKAYIEDIITCL